MNEIDKPQKCEEKDCKNKAYGKNYLSPNNYEWVCRTHYYQYVYGIDINGQRRSPKACRVCDKKLDKENNSGLCTRHRPRTENNNSCWKGRKVSYVGIHAWIKRKNVKPLICEHCQSNKNIEFANISGEYKRDVDDWLILCARCHKRFDRHKEYVCPRCGGSHSLWKCSLFKVNNNDLIKCIRFPLSEEDKKLFDELSQSSNGDDKNGS